jgi:hypothetical protein
MTCKTITSLDIAKLVLACPTERVDTLVEIIDSLVALMDGVQAHDLQSQTGLDEDKCNRIAAVAAAAAKWSIAWHGPGESR